MSERRYNLDENDIWLALFACGAIDPRDTDVAIGAPRGRIRLGLPVGGPDDSGTILCVYVQDPEPR